MSTQARLLQLDRRDLRKVVEALPESSPSVLLSSLDSAEAQVQQISNQIAELNAKLAQASEQIGAAKRQATPPSSRSGPKTKSARPCGWR